MVVAVTSVDDRDVTVTIILVRNLRHVLPCPLILQMGMSWLWPDYLISSNLVDEQPQGPGLLASV